MQRISSTLRRAVFGAAVAGALGFGATQALAAPAEPAGAAACNTCWHRCPQYGGVLYGGGCLCCFPSRG